MSCVDEPDLTATPPVFKGNLIFKKPEDAWIYIFFFFSSRRRHTRSLRDWSSDVCSSDLSETCANSRCEKSVIRRGCDQCRKFPSVSNDLLWRFLAQFSLSTFSTE